jgi:hypothetical protein
MSVLAMAAALTMTACSDEAEESADTTSDPGEPPASEEPGEPGDSPDADAPQEGQAAGQATAGEAVATWISAIVEDRPLDACLVMGTSGDGGAPTGNTAAMCEGDSPEAGQAGQLVSTLAESFTPESRGEPPVVEVTEGTEPDGTATFDGQQITMDGRTLQDVVVSNSTGVEPGQIGIEIDASQIDGLWYVTDMNLSFG